MEHSERKILLDDLYVRLFYMVEEQVRCKLDIEKHQSAGHLLLAKTRYIQGSQSIGLAQIPTEQSNEFSALNKVEKISTDDTLSGNKMQLTKNAVNNDSGHMDPIRWFSALPPSSLRLASHHFNKCVELVVESANIQLEIHRAMKDIVRLKKSLKPNDSEKQNK